MPNNPGYYDNPENWQSWDDIPAWWSTAPGRMNVGYNPRHMAQHRLAINRGESRQSTPSMNLRPGDDYGRNTFPTMGIQQYGVGSIPGASSEYNQLMAISRAKNRAINENFGNWTEYVNAGMPTDIFDDLNLPDVGEMRIRAGGPENQFGAPPPGYLQSEHWLNSPTAMAQRGWNYDEETGFSRAPIPQGQTYGDQPYVPMPGQFGYRASQAPVQPQGNIGTTGGQTQTPVMDDSGYLNMPGATGGGTAQARVSPLNMPVFDSPSDWFQPGQQLGTTGLQRGFNPFGTGDLGQFSAQRGYAGPLGQQAAQAAALRG